MHEWIPPVGKNESEDILILAGDVLVVADIGHHIPFLRNISTRFKEVIWVFGNHESYGMSIEDSREMAQRNLTEEGLINIHILENQAFEVDNKTVILGSTLWSNFNDKDTTSMELCEAWINDFKMIEGHNAISSFITHNKSLSIIREFMEGYYSGMDAIIVTHHAPSIQSVSDDFLSHPAVSGFFSRLDDFILDLNPKIWIHGHLHKNSSYRIGDTNILCNPKGYPFGKGKNDHFNVSGNLI